MRLGFYVAFLIKSIRIWLVTEQNKKVLGHYFCLILTSSLGPGARKWKFQKKTLKVRISLLLTFLAPVVLLELLQALEVSAGPCDGGGTVPGRVERKIGCG